jgi:cysteinyl-tRNA synthetase
MVIRHVLLSTHYRSPLDWTEARVSEATALLNFWHRVSATALRKGLESSTDPSPDGELLERLADDLDTPGALQRLHRLAENARPGSNTDAMRSFLNGVDLFGFQPAGTAGKDVSASVERAFDQVDRAWASLDAKAAELHAARMRKDYATADRIRAELEALGVAVQSTAEGTTWTPTVAFDARKVEALKP